MNEIENSSVFPVALWLKESPVHNISSLIFLNKKKLIATGCENGHIIIWSLNSTGDELIPDYYLIGHKSKVTNLILAGSSTNTTLEYFASFSSEGEIALWEAEEGRNIEFVTNPQMNIQYAFSYESTNTKQRLILCCLKNREIFVLNSMSLAHICTLVCTSSPNWFSSVTLFNKSIKDDIIMATSVSGLVSIWIVNFTDVHKQSKGNLVIDADQYVDIGTVNSFKITNNQYSDSIALIITPNQFKIYHIEDWSVLSFQDCHRGDYFIDGDFVSPGSVVLHTKSGKSFLYQLPPRSNCESNLFKEKSTNICDSIPTLLFQFVEPNEINLWRHNIQIQKINEEFVIWKAFSNGNIYRWEFNSSNNKMSQNLFSLDDSWKKIKKTPTSLTQSMETSNITGIVTCLIFIHDLSIIVLGMENGWIIIRNICDTLIHTFTENDSTSDTYIILKGHSGPVTCLLHPSSTMKLPSLMTSTKHIQSQISLKLLKLTNILWSGGVDYTIRVWDFKNEKMLNIFHCHSAPLVSLKLNHLPLNSMIMCGVSQGFTAAMYNAVNEDEENSHIIKQMINMCMNAFLVGIDENDGISIISIMKQKVLLYASHHNSPVRNLGWLLNSGYLLVDTIENTVYVWDLASGIMDRWETGETAKLLMEHCPLITKIRSKKNISMITGSKSVRRHSLSNIVSSDLQSGHGSNNKFIRSQFIYCNDIRRQVPILIFNISALLDSLSNCNTISTSICDILDGAEKLFPQEQESPSPTKKKSLSDLDHLIKDVKLDKQNFNLKILVMKIILSITNLSSKDFEYSSVMFNADKLVASVGQINSKTGCVSFNLKPLFKNISHVTTENMLIQLSISNKIISISNSALFDSFLNIYLKQDLQNEIKLNMSSQLSRSNSNGLVYSDKQASSLIVKSFKTHRKWILNKLLNEYLLSFKGEINDMSFNILENLFNKLIVGILDICDTISKSSLQLMAKVINGLTDQQIQNYILIWRIFLSSDLDSYGLEDGKTFLNKIQPFLDKFIEFSYLSCDWVWWYSKEHLNTDHEKRNLSKIQIKALLNIALVGSHLLSDEVNNETEDLKLFSKLFTLDKSFLARITCDFLMSVLSRKPQKSKSNIGRLINLSMICLSTGFLVWEPYLDSNTVICKFLYFAIDLEDTNIDDKFLSLVSRKAVENIAKVRPLIFIMVCYREMLRWCTSSSMLFSSTSFSGNRSLDRRKSSPSLTSLIDNDKISKPFSLLNRNILVPIFNDLCQHQSNTILDVLPELVELYIFFYIKEEDFSSFMLPVSKFSSVSLNESCGQVSVGSISGFLILFDLKIGKYFSISAHKKSIRITKFSEDGKFVASYCAYDNIIKIWQISSGLFSLGGNSHQVKLINSQVLPSLEQMLTAAKISSRYLKTDHILEKDSDIYLEWDTDNKQLSMKILDVTLKQIKI